MSKKAKGIIKFFVACGVVVSAALAVFAILYRMRAKLKEPAETEEELGDEGLCDGGCETCGMCGDEDAADTEEEAEAAEEAAEPEEADVNE